MGYESFINSKNKFSKIWEKYQANSNEIENSLDSLQVDFSSVSFSKKITTIPIIENHEIDVFFQETITVQLNNIPEWIINHINVFSLVTPIGDVNTDVVTLDTTNLKVGDIIPISRAKYWYTSLSNNNYLLKIEIFVNPRIVTSVVDESFITAPLASTLDLSLKIINPRMYGKK
jgi:hypothetical protein